MASLEELLVQLQGAGRGAALDVQAALLATQSMAFQLPLMFARAGVLLAHVGSTDEVHLGAHVAFLVSL